MKTIFPATVIFPEEYFYNLTEYCIYMSRKDSRIQVRLLGERNTLEKAEIHCMKEGLKLLVIEFNFLFKKKSYV